MVTDKPKRVGIMGGTFNPIHNGHLILAECAYDQFKLDKILFIPNGKPPHKDILDDSVSNQDRQEMVRLAILNNPHFELDTEEMLRYGYSYTKDTLRRLCEAHKDTTYYFIIGGDSLMSFDQWYCPDEICKYCILLAAVRHQMNVEDMERQMDHLRSVYGAKIEMLHTPELDISSSRLRQMHSRGESIRYYIPDIVYDYIRRTGLYENSKG